MRECRGYQRRVGACVRHRMSKAESLVGDMGGPRDHSVMEGADSLSEGFDIYFECEKRIFPFSVPLVT